MGDIIIASSPSSAAYDLIRGVFSDEVCLLLDFSDQNTFTVTTKHVRKIIDIAFCSPCLLD